MTDEGRKLLQLALLLSPKERVEIAARLVDSVNTIAAAEAGWNREVERRARRTLEHELCPVFYLGRSPVPLRFDADAELDLERTVGRYADQPARVEVLLAALTDAIDRIRDAPCTFGMQPTLPDELGVRRFQLPELPYAVLYVPLGKELRILAITDKLHPPDDGEVTIEAICAVEDWLAAAGLRVATFLPVGAIAAGWQ